MNVVFAGRLLTSPFLGEIYLSNIRPYQLVTEDDFIAYTSLARASWAPVLMSFGQKSEFLNRIVEHVVDAVGQHNCRILLNCRVPGIRMPMALGKGNVFQVVDLSPEITRLTRAGESFVSIYEGFVRHPLEIGHNELLVEWHNCPDAAAVSRFRELSFCFFSMGFVADIHSEFDPPQEVRHE